MNRLTRMKAWAQGQITAWRARAATLAKAIGPDTAVHALGLVLLGLGAAQVYRPAGLIVPGALLVWWTLPSRPGFIVPPRGPQDRGDTK